MKLSQPAKLALGAVCGIIGVGLFAIDTTILFSALAGKSQLVLLDLPLNLWTYIGFTVPLIACAIIYLRCLNITINKKASFEDFMKTLLPMFMTIMSGLALIDITYSMDFNKTKSLLLKIPVTEGYLITSAAAIIVYLFIISIRLEKTNIFISKEEIE